jgi:3-dehydroquinate dehydratase/shikimate dehydrogenase
VIISYHNFKQTPKNLEAIYKKIKSHKPDIIKIVTHANSINDNIKILNLIKKAKKQNKKIIALCMGGKGEISRILSPLIGAQLTFASLNKERESAPGQLTAEALIKTYNICKLKSPKIYGLVGNPVSHSKGIIVHNKNFGKLKQNKIYVNFLVSNIKEFIKNYREIISGLSITIPHKKTIMPYLNKIEPTAKKIGAVNTVIKKNNKLIGYNTDYVGAIKAIKEKTAIKNKNVLIIGAGGVSKAIAYGVKKERGQIIITNRTVSKATALAKQISCKSININQIKNLKGIDILINATSIGMKSKKAPITKQILKKITVSSSVVFDSVYTPPITQLLKDAKSLKLKTISGEKMFTYQAQEQFKLFN